MAVPLPVKVPEPTVKVDKTARVLGKVVVLPLCPTIKLANPFAEPVPRFPYVSVFVPFSTSVAELYCVLSSVPSAVKAPLPVRVIVLLRAVNLAVVAWVKSPFVGSALPMFTA